MSLNLFNNCASEDEIPVRCATDSISGKDLNGHAEGKPCFVDGQGYDYQTVYFDSEVNKRIYMAIPTEPSCFCFSNDVDEGCVQG